MLWKLKIMKEKPIIMETYKCKTKILLVDTQVERRDFLKELFKDEYIILEASSAIAAIEILHELTTTIGAILLELHTQNFNSYEILDIVKSEKCKHNIPVIALSDDLSAERIEYAYEQGIEDVIVKPFYKNAIKVRVQTIIERYSYHQHLENIIRKQEKLIQRQRYMQHSDNQIIDILNSTIEFKCLDAVSHSHNVRFLTKALLYKLVRMTNAYALNYDDIEKISKASALHSYANTMLKDKLHTFDKEYRKNFFKKNMQSIQDVDGLHIITKDEQILVYCYDICQYFHERWDGQGKLIEIKDDNIPIWVQAVTLADTFDMLTNHQVYKNIYRDDEAYNRIQKGEYGVFQPLLLTCLKELIPLIKQDENGKKSYMLAKCKETENIPFTKLQDSQWKNPESKLHNDIELLKDEIGNQNKHTMYDKLTKLYNQKVFKLLIEEEFIKGEQNIGGLFFLDLDNFKSANDILGKTYGDAVLQRTASLIKSHLRSDDIFARWEKDEFIIWMRGTNDKRVLYNRAHNFCHILQNTELAGLRVVKISTSIGIARYPNDGLDYASLLLHAKKALAYVKKHDKGQAICYEDII